MSAQLTLQRHATALFPGITKRSTSTRTKDGIVMGLLAAALIGLIVADTYPSERAESGSVKLVEVLRPATPAATQDVGVFTGNYVNGLAVYRLAPIDVTANREAR